MGIRFGGAVGRSLGGRNSQLNRRANPDFYRSLGCLMPNVFHRPNKSQKLAELIGIVLGDGGLTRDQCQITLSFKDDREFAVYVSDLIEELFAKKPTIAEYPNHGCRRVIITGVDFVRMMVGFGLRIGNKTKNQVEIPGWIRKNKLLYKASIRGLFDTDGGTFTHRHWVGGHRYRHFGITFTSASKPILNGFYTYLNVASIKCRVTEYNIFIYSLVEVKKFFDLIKPKNRKHIARYAYHLSVPTRLN